MIDQQQLFKSTIDAQLKAIKIQQQFSTPMLNTLKLRSYNSAINASKMQIKLSESAMNMAKMPIKVSEIAINIAKIPIKASESAMNIAKIQQQLNKQTKILQSIITSSTKLSSLSKINTNFIENNFENNKELLYNLWSIDWYIPIWKIPIVIDNTYINNPLNSHLLKELDDELFDQLKNEVNNETNFLKHFDNNDIGLFYLYKNRSYKDVVLLSLIKIESILTNFINYLDNKKIPNLYDYLNGNREEYESFHIKDKQIYKQKLENLKLSTTDTFDKNALICLIYLFSDESTSQLYRTFNRGSKKFRCKVTPSGEIPLCRNLFLHGLGYEDDISQKLATKALFAYKFFKEFSINK